MQKALSLTRIDPDAELFVTGGAVKSKAEGTAMKRWLVSKGINSNRIIVESKARNTIENMLFTIPLILKQKFKNITLVTSDFHIYRAHAILKAILDKANIHNIHILPVSSKSGLINTNRMKREKIAILRDLSQLFGVW